MFDGNFFKNNLRIIKSKHILWVNGSMVVQVSSWREKHRDSSLVGWRVWRMTCPDLSVQALQRFSLPMRALVRPTRRNRCGVVTAEAAGLLRNKITPGARVETTCRYHIYSLSRSQANLQNFLRLLIFSRKNVKFKLLFHGSLAE